MRNMSYCRFENTLSDLNDCLRHIHAVDLSDEEFKARQELIRVCEKIIEEATDVNGEYVL